MSVTRFITTVFVSDVLFTSLLLIATRPFTLLIRSGPAAFNAGRNFIRLFVVSFVIAFRSLMSGTCFTGSLKAMLVG